MTTIHYPESNDLRKLIRFCEGDGTIWLDESRMVLMHTASLAALRKELILSVGQEHTRRILTRMGYVSGVRDAELAKRIRGNQSMIDAFLCGPQLHMLEGVARVTPVRMHADIEAGEYDGEFLWHNSWEEEAHRKEFGEADEPVCWTQIGYASGFTSAFFGRFILFKEVECVGRGDNQCRIVGKPLEEWEDADQHASYFESDSMLTHLLTLRNQVDCLRTTISQQSQAANLIGVSNGFRQAHELINKASRTSVTVLLLGETGVGKERFARALHHNSERRDNPFIAVNCAALPHDLIESELFGVEKGAYTGAQNSRLGKFERADGGTLFLDEVGELPLAAQAKLLRVLQEGEIERLGDDRTRKVNIRLVAATNVDLTKAVLEGRFRADLFYRLNVYPVTIPPLRERITDIQPLVEAMLERFCTLHDKRLLGVTDRTLQALKTYPWPGNIRELENVIERGTILAPQGGWVELEHLFANINATATPAVSISASGELKPESAGQAAMPWVETLLDSKLSLDEIESTLLNEAVKRSSGNLAGAARLLGITRPQLQYRLNRKGNAPQ